MSDLKWKIEDGIIWVLIDYVDRPRWRSAEPWESAKVVEMAIASTQEKCAMEVDATVKDHDEDTPGGWCAANAARYAAAAIRSLQITATPNPKRE